MEFYNTTYQSDVYDWQPDPAFWDRVRLLCQSDAEMTAARHIVEPMTEQQHQNPPAVVERIALSTIEANLMHSRAHSERRLECVPLTFRGGWRTLCERAPALKGKAKTLANWSARLLRGASVSHGWWLSGPVGTGKTGLARGLQVYLLEHGYLSVMTYNLADLFRALKSSYDQPGGSRGFLRPLSECGLLILDDLGATAMSEADKAALLAIADQRYENRMPMIVTSNYSLDDVTKTSSREMVRAADRWREAMRELKIDGPSLRVGKGDGHEEYWEEKGREYRAA